MDYNKIISNIESELVKLEEKTFKVFFFVYDSQGMPSGPLIYIYNLAYSLKEMGYDVRMLYAENDFVGVNEWLGEKYAKLPHYQIDGKQIDVSSSDFLFIPEIYSDVMIKTKEMPCKRIAILNNFNFLTELMSPSVSWDEIGINRCITSTNNLSTLLKETFPNVKTDVIRPVILTDGVEPVKQKKLIVNVVANTKTEVNRFVKPFFWRNPLYKWVTFRDLRSTSHSECIKAMNESLITVWLDEHTNFGYTPLESMAMGNIVIGKIPEIIPEWMHNDDYELIDNGVWFNNIDDGIDLTCRVLQSYLVDNIPHEMMELSKKTADSFTQEIQNNDIKKYIIDGIFEERKNELKIALSVTKNNLEENKDDNE